MESDTIGFWNVQENGMYYVNTQGKLNGIPNNSAHARGMLIQIGGSKATPSTHSGLYQMFLPRDAKGIFKRSCFVTGHEEEQMPDFEAV